ncbi:F-box protein CPR1-like [Telopea speciosissima]|uniref:F-box protein CPR1-like n=1 Tax=Telopea speciosissima TaxID=54955 RepID=UPI001CC53577|nr:F-box protein CPR1-like [Telopea speciosissima]
MAEDKKKKINEEEEAMLMPNKNLPEDLIADILSRLPVKSLLRFRCVSKPWCALITDPAFVKMHLNRSLATNSNLNLILINSSFNLYSVDLDAWEQQAAVKLHLPLKSPNYKAKIVGSCNGLLCISYSDDDIFLWNPSTRRHQKLPITPIEFPFDNRLRYIVYGFGYDSTSDDYKLVRVVRFFGDHHYPGLTSHSEVKIYSLRTNSWRRIGDLPIHLRYIYNAGNFANSALHWVGINSKFIVSFDLKDEEFREVPLPDSAENEFPWDVEFLKGQLCLLHTFRFQRVEFWMMKDSWVKVFSIEHPWLIWGSGKLLPICYLKNGEFLLSKNTKGPLILYDPRRGRVRYLQIHGVPDTAGRTFIKTCFGSLVPLNAKDGIEEPKTKKSRKLILDVNIFCTHCLVEIFRVLVRLSYHQSYYEDEEDGQEKYKSVVLKTKKCFLEAAVVFILSIVYVIGCILQV